MEQDLLSKLMVLVKFFKFIIYLIILLKIVLFQIVIVGNMFKRMVNAKLVQIILNLVKIKNHVLNQFVIKDKLLI